MPGAVNNQRPSVATCPIKQAPSWSPGSIGTINSSFLLRSDCLRNPNYTYNHQRADKSWPRSAWSKSWFRCAAPVTSWGTKPIPGKSVWFNPPGSRTPVVGDFFLTSTNQWSNLGKFKPPPQDFIVVDQVTRTKVLNKISQKKWDVGVTVAEFRQTAGLVKDAADSLVDTIQGLVNMRRNAAKQVNQLLARVRKHGDFYRAAAETGMRDTALLNKVRDRWMQYQFGVRPLYGDIYNAGTALSESIFGHSNGLLVSAKAGHEVTRVIRVALPVVNAPFTTHVRMRCVTQGHASVSYRVPTTGIPTFNMLGLDNPYSIAYEQARLSWMFDYLVGAGDWLSSFSAAKGLEFIDGSMSTVWRAISLDVEINLKEPSKLRWDEAPRKSGVYIEAGEFERVLLAHGVTPAFVPQVKSTLGLVQLGNSLFALSHVFSGNRGPR